MADVMWIYINDLMMEYYTTFTHPHTIENRKCLLSCKTAVRIWKQGNVNNSTFAKWPVLIISKLAKY